MPRLVEMDQLAHPPQLILGQVPAAGFIEVGQAQKRCGGPQLGAAISASFVLAADLEVDRRVRPGMGWPETQLGPAGQSDQLQRRLRAERHHQTHVAGLAPHGLDQRIESGAPRPQLLAGVDHAMTGEAARDHQRSVVLGQQEVDLRQRKAFTDRLQQRHVEKQVGKISGIHCQDMRFLSQSAGHGERRGGFPPLEKTSQESGHELALYRGQSVSLPQRPRVMLPIQEIFPPKHRRRCARRQM